MKRCILFGVLFLAFAGASSRTPMDRASVLARMNEHRATEHLPPLREDARLTRAAEARMRDMIELEYWSHDAPDGRSPFLWLAPNGYSYRAAAENLARGFETSELVVDSWMESGGHRANILGADYTDVGIAILDGATTGKGAGKSVVVLFGSE